MDAIGSNIEPADSLDYCSSADINPETKESENNGSVSAEAIFELTYQDSNTPLPSENYTDISKSILMLYCEQRCKIEISINNKLWEYFSDKNRNFGDLKKYYKRLCESEDVEILQTMIFFIMIQIIVVL
jgi:hypothetical protein